MTDADGAVFGAGVGEISDPDVAPTQGSWSMRVKLLQASAVPWLIPLPGIDLPAIGLKFPPNSLEHFKQGVYSHSGGEPFVSAPVPALHTSEHALIVAAP